MSILERIRIQSNVDLDPSSDGGSLIFYLFIDLFLQIRQYRDNTIYLSSSSTFFWCSSLLFSRALFPSSSHMMSQEASVKLSTTWVR
jgi:hypothetical protein